MIFEDGSGYQAVAKLLATMANEPKHKDNVDALLRSAMSRGYYAVFLKARQRLRREHKVIPSENVHKAIVDLFASDPDDFARNEIADGLRSLREQRNKADYDVRYIVTYANLQLALFQMDDLLEKLSRL